MWSGWVDIVVVSPDVEDDDDDYEEMGGQMLKEPSAHKLHAAVGTWGVDEVPTSGC